MNRRFTGGCLVLGLALFHSVASAADTAPGAALRQYISESYQKLTPAQKAKLNPTTGSTRIKTPSPGQRPNIETLGQANAMSLWGNYEKVEIPGATCGDGSPYKIFVMRANTAIDRYLGNDRRLTIQFEPGGACWDYLSCSGQLGLKGAAHPDGIPDNFMDLNAYLDPNVPGGSMNAVLSPVIMKFHPLGQSVKTAYWNKVFLPYCTGDVYIGNKVATYTDPATGKTMTYRHVGATNMEKVVEWLRKNFPHPRELMVAGTSAGGAGATVNYHFLRKALKPAKAYFLNDSGPIFPSPGYGNQYPLHQMIRQAWNVDYVINRLEQEGLGTAISRDYGSIPTLLADAWPQDKFGITLFRRDALYSWFSYALFHQLDDRIPEHKEKMIQLWGEDLRNLMTQFSSRPNMSYYIPYFRNVMFSHCTTIVEWNGSEIQAQGVNVGNYINSLLNDQHVVSRVESDNPADANVPNILTEILDLL